VYGIRNSPGRQKRRVHHNGTKINTKAHKEDSRQKTDRDQRSEDREQKGNKGRQQKSAQPDDRI
jgi:hypothetical protein